MVAFSVDALVSDWASSSFSYPALSLMVVPGEQLGAEAVVPGEQLGAEAVVPGVQLGAEAVVPGVQLGAEAVVVVWLRPQTWVSDSGEACSL